MIATKLIPARQVAAFLNALRGGTFFTVVFIKRTNDEERTMTCRQGRQGSKQRVSIDSEQLVTTWSTDTNGFRSFYSDSVIELRGGGAILQAR